MTQTKEEVSLCRQRYRELHREELKLKNAEYFRKNRNIIMEKRKVYKQKNKERLRQSDKKYNDLHSDDHKKYYMENREKILSYTKQYKLDHKEQYKKYREENKEKLRIAYKKYQDANKDHISKRYSEYLKTPAGKAKAARSNHCRRAREKNTLATLTVKEFNKILLFQNNRCAICNIKFSKTVKPTRDHIVPLFLGGALTFENTQALCISCNTKKSYKLDKTYIQSWL